MWYILEYRVHDILQRRPTPDDLRQLASSANSRFKRLIHENDASLEDTLCTVFKFASGDRQVTGGRLLVAGSAAISVLIDGPAALRTVRPPLARWYAAHATKLRELGPMAPPRSPP